MSGFDLIIKPDDEEDVEAAEVLVHGTIGGRMYCFLLDTGAARTCVTYDEYTSTFDCIARESSSGVFERGGNDLITMPSIELGSIRKTSFTLARTAELGPNAHNLIGMDLLKDYCCHFFFDEHKVSVDPNDGPADGYAFEELLLDSRLHPYVDVHFGDVIAKAVWDTGAGITVVDLNFIERFSTFFQELGQSQGTDSTGAQRETPMFNMATTHIGRHQFPPHQVAGVDLSHVNSTIEVPMDLILGYSTLSRANWLLDFPRRRWAISRLLGNTELR